MRSEERPSLDRILECSVVLSWADLIQITESGLVHVDYGFGPGDSIEYLKLWSSTTRGQWNLVCEYWMSASQFHASGIHFENGYKSDNLAHTLGLIMEHQNAFVPSPNLGRNGLLQIQQPTQKERTDAGSSMAGAFEHIQSVLMRPTTV
jgi:hypothetical protein